MGLQTHLPIEILDYVQVHEPSEDSVYGISQRELAKALGYHPCSMSRPLQELVRGGLLAARRGLVRDGRRKQITYRLTPTGLAQLRKETSEVPLLTGGLPPPPHPFLGRRDELEQLGDFSRQPNSIVVIEGPPGMGKTALVCRFLRRVKRGRIPFWFTVRATSSPRQFVSALSHALTSLGNPQLAYYSQLPRNPVAREVADMAARSLGAQSLAAVLDDFQVAAPDMRSFLLEFVAALAGRGAHQFFVIGQEVTLQGLDSSIVRRLPVGGLDRASAHELTDRHGGLADRFESIYQSTLGSPLLLQLAVSNPDAQGDAASIPLAVVKRLTPIEFKAILPSALANEPLPVSFLTEELGLSLGRAQELERIGVLHRTLEDKVEVLQVVRTAILSRVGPSDERDAQLELARYYGRSHRPEALRERFLHLVEGEDWKAAYRLLDEQQRVIVRLGYSESLRNALRHLSSAVPKGLPRVRVLFAEAALSRAHSDFDEAIRTFRRSIGESDDEKRMVCEAHLSIVELLVRLRQVEDARREFSAARKSDASTRRLQAFFTLSEARIVEGEGDSQKAAELYRAAFDQARKAHATDLALESIAAWSRFAELTGGPSAAIRLVEAALPDARQSGRMDIVFNLLLVRARAHSETGRSDEAEVEMNAIRSEAESLGYLTQLTYTLSGLAAMAFEHGRWPEGSAYAKQASSLAEKLGNDVVLGHTLAVQCASGFKQVELGGDVRALDEAISYGLRSVEVLNRVPPSDSLVLAHGYLVQALLFKGEQEAAKDHYRLAIELADRLRLSWLKDTITSEFSTRIALAQGRGTQEAT